MLKKQTSANHEATLLGINSARVLEWISLYQSLGENGLITTSKNTTYSAGTKTNAVLDYLHGKGSYSEICRKYGIHSSTQLRNWIMKYNGHEKLKDSGAGGTTIMTKGRKTTFEECVEIEINNCDIVPWYCLLVADVELQDKMVTKDIFTYLLASDLAVIME